MEQITINFDGGAVLIGQEGSNYNVAGYAFIIQYKEKRLQSAKIIDEGKHLTNNIGEYTGLLQALRCLKWYQETDRLPENVPVKIYGDSKMVINMVAGVWGKYKPHKEAPHLQDLLSNCKMLLPQNATLEWIPREQNKQADKLYNKALKKYKEFRKFNLSPKDQAFWDSIPEYKPGETKVDEAPSKPVFGEDSSKYQKKK